MLAPFQLRVFPSCYSSLSCSEDGELALAAGEYVHVVTPKAASDSSTSSAPPSTSSNWQIARFRANVFTNKEWPMMLPQGRKDFSIGPEQSNSTVAGLAWSPPGLAKHRRCVLAVLTTNLILSFYEAVGPEGKWTRVAVVNEALRRHFRPIISDSSLSTRKSNIRSFAWSPPLAVPTSEGTTEFAEHRWGIPLLAVTNDDNDVIFLRAQRSIKSPDISDSYTIDVLSLISLDDPIDNYPVGQPSIFASAVNARLKTLSMSYGPWLYQNYGKDDPFAVSNIAVVYGEKLKIIRQDVKVRLSMADTNIPAQCELSSKTVENTAMYNDDINGRRFNGPLHWIHTDKSAEVHLFAGSMAGLTLVTASQAAYKMSTGKLRPPEVQEWPFYNETAENSKNDCSEHWEPIGAMTSVWDERSKTCTLHLGTVGGYTGCIKLPAPKKTQLSPPPWQTQVDEICERFDIDRDLGGFTVAKVWGLASYRGIVVAAITKHPGDMIEYRTSAEDTTVLVFSGANSRSDAPTRFPAAQDTLERDQSPDTMRANRKVVLDYVLNVDKSRYDERAWSRKILYAAACCALVESHDEALLSLARKAFEWLSSSMGLDLGEEISKCSSTGSTLEAKSEEQLRGPGQEVFERCEVCDSGIAWYSSQEGQCSSGHLFVRCGLSFLSIQEPGLSKFCSGCDTEYYNEDVIDSAHGIEFQHAYSSLSDVFDTCVYCKGKFRS